MKHFKTFFLTLAFLGLSVSNTFAQTAPVYVGPRTNSYDDPVDGIYVSPSGNDATATGAIDAPYKSINTALATAQSGSTIILRSGKYLEGASVRVREPNITIKSKKGEWAIIELPFTDDPNNGNCGVFFNPEASNCKLQSVEVIGGFYAVCMDTKWGWGGSDDWMAASDIIIEDCKLHDSRYDVVKVKPNCKNITIRYNEIYNSGKAFPPPYIGENNAEGIDNVNGGNMTVHNNYIHDICSTGIYAKGGATDVLIENNLIKQTYGSGILVGFDTSPEFFNTEENPEYYENIRGVVHNNLIIDAGHEGIGFYASKDAHVYHNTLVNVGNGGLYHSAIYFGITYQDWEEYAGRPASIHPNIHHNIVCQPTSFVLPMIDIRYDDNEQLGILSALEGNPTMNDNCYYVAGKSAIFSDHRQGSILENAGLPAWKLHIDGDNGSLETDTALGSDYMHTNTQCTEMGIRSPFIINNPLGIVTTTLNNRIAVYPNPTTGVLNLIQERITNYELRIKDVEIFDIFGKKLSSHHLITSSSNHLINISDLPTGIYFIKIFNENNRVETFKIIKQ